ncbi:tetratricopeptide repeat protein [Pseudoduganella sp. OTU4001]|uniref:tetratricopeptide repeat protein n=1 Tax=Pseudoduganella sp. OTU4001 TaxID=3043854 RepID=UPI00313A842C
MNARRQIKARGAASAGAAALAALCATGPSQALREPAFDPLLDGALCESPAAGRPVLLAMLAQTETAPFKAAQQPRKMDEAGPPPLYKDLGKLHMSVTTRSPRAQEYFDQGLRLLFAFNHAEAARAFRAAQQADPQCAMCHWGEALVLGPNINAPMFPEAVAPAAAAAERAAAAAGSASPVEQALVRAVAKRYAAQPPADRAPLDQAYAAAMTEAARSFPNDDTVQVLFAESLMDLSPWDYWEAGGASPKGRTAELVDALERVLERNPSHPGAIHYYIHAVEASTHPDKALPYARQLAQQIPGAGHIVHMPSHIYYRVGLYKEALQSNLDAIAIDEKYFTGAASDAVYKGAYYPHNIHFAMVSALMGGDGKATLQATQRLEKSISPELLRAIPPMQPVRAAPYFAHVQFSSPETLLALPDPGAEFTLLRAMWHYARAVGLARKGMWAESQQQIDAIAAIEQKADFKPLLDWGVPAPVIAQTARLVASGKLAEARGELPAAIKAFTEAVAVQDTLPYTEPPYWYYPVRQSLGAALLKAGRLDEAEAAFRASFAKTPSNGWALRGLVEVYDKRGDKAAAAATRKRFGATWLGPKGGPEMNRL